MDKEVPEEAFYEEMLPREAEDTIHWRKIQG